MIIETKFNIGDTVWFTQGGLGIISGEIYKIKAEYFNNSYEVVVSYRITGNYDKTEENIYSSKEEAGIAWLKAQGLDCGLKG